MSQRYSAALPITHVVLRVLLVLNWIYGAAIFVLLVAMPTRRWIMSSLHLSPGPDADWVVFGLRSIAAIGLVTIPINFVILKRLLSIVESVRAGQPFVGLNAVRLQTIAWGLLALQVLSIVIGTIARAIAAPGRPLDIDAGFSINGWLAVLFAFVLARVFAEGALMREDLEGTV